jgi:hypothetical protein
MGENIKEETERGTTWEIYYYKHVFLLPLFLPSYPCFPFLTSLRKSLPFGNPLRDTFEISNVRKTT